MENTLLMLLLHDQDCIIGESFPVVNAEKSPRIEPLVSKFATFILSPNTILKSLTHTPEHHDKLTKPQALA